MIVQIALGIVLGGFLLNVPRLYSAWRYYRAVTAEERRGRWSLRRPRLVRWSGAICAVGSYFVWSVSPPVAGWLACWAVIVALAQLYTWVRPYLNTKLF